MTKTEILPEAIGISLMRANGREYLVDHEHEEVSIGSDPAMYTKDRWRILIDDGLMMSVVRGTGSYGYSKGLFEIAFLDTKSGRFSKIFQSEWLDDVLGYLTEEEVLEWLRKAETV